MLIQNGNISLIFVISQNIKNKSYIPFNEKVKSSLLASLSLMPTYSCFHFFHVITADSSTGFLVKIQRCVLPDIIYQLTNFLWWSKLFCRVTSIDKDVLPHLTWKNQEKKISIIVVFVSFLWLKWARINKSWIEWELHGKFMRNDATHDS